MFTSNQIADRIKQRAKELGTTVRDVLAQCCLGNNTLVNMRAGSMPKSDNLAKIGAALDCSVDYLLGLTDDPKRPPDKKSPASDQERDELIHAALAGTGLLGNDGLLTKEGAAVIAKFLNQNSEMLNQLLKKEDNQ